MKGKYPFREFVLDHSEDYEDGLSLIMKIKENVKSKITQFDSHILIWEIQPNEKWAIIEAWDTFEKKHNISELTKEQRRMAVSSLLKDGIADETEI